MSVMSSATVDQDSAEETVAPLLVALFALNSGGSSYMLFASEGIRGTRLPFSTANFSTSRRSSLSNANLHSSWRMKDNFPNSKEWSGAEGRVVVGALGLCSSCCGLLAPLTSTF